LGDPDLLDLIDPKAYALSPELGCSFYPSGEWTLDIIGEPLISCALLCIPVAKLDLADGILSLIFYTTFLSFNF